MSLLPSPIPHPLDYSPWQLPGWVYEALDWVIGVEWPEGNERAVWELADQWYAVAAALAGPQADAVAAAGEVRGGYGGVGAVAAAFDTAWRRVAEGDEAPLPVLFAVSTELGRLVEECGCDIEGAKLEVWIELGILVVELLSLAVATVLTAGAASPAAGVAITATRLIVQQIFKRLMAQLARKSLKQGLKEAGERAAKEVTKGGVRGFSRRAAVSGLSEAADESGINLATQAYQNSTGRRHGLDVTELGTTALGGMAGGMVAPLAGLGRHATSRGARIGEHFGREMAGEVMADQAASLATGQGLTSVEDAARAAASGARGSATAQADAALQARLDGQLSALAGMPLTLVDGGIPTQSSTPISDSAPGGEAFRHAVPTPDVAARQPVPAVDVNMSAAEVRPVTGALVSPDASAPESGGRIPEQRGTSSGAQPQAFDAAPAAHVASPGTEGGHAEARSAPLSTQEVEAGNRLAPPASHVEASRAPLDLTLSSVVLEAHPSAAHAPAPAAPPSPASESVPSAGPATNTGAATTAPPTTGGPTPSTSAVTSPLSGLPAQASPVATAGPASPGETAPRNTGPQTGAVRVPDLPPGTSANGTPTDRTPEAAPHPARPVGQPSPRPRTPEWYAARWAADQDAFERRRYRGHFEFQRTTHEQNRRRDSAARLRQAAEGTYDEARWLVSEGRRLAEAGHDATADRYFLGARDRERWYHQQRDLAEEVLEGVAAPSVVAVGDKDFRRINDDVGDLAYGAVETSDRSALTGDGHPPPIDRSRNYGRPGGLRPPLALHQTDVERQMPREPDGSVRRNADPRTGGWFGLVNDGGPRADPTRGINCIDCTLSLFDTWLHGRPRVAAPRTFDAYVAGDVARPINGERDGTGRVEDVTGGRFQRLCQPTDDVQGAERQRAIDTGYRNLHAQLRLGGHGSFAFVVNSFEQGGSHIWVALNQNGTILYLDPQSGAVSDAPLYQHRGTPHPYNAVDTEVLVLGSDGRPMPLGGLRRGRFSERPDLPQYPPAETDEGYGELYLNRLYLLDGPGSAPSDGSTSAGLPPQADEAGSTPERSDAPSKALRAEQERAPAERAADSTPVSAILAVEPDLERVFAAGVTPVEAAAGLDPSTLRRLVPQLDEPAAGDVARLFADPRVQRMLDDTWQKPPKDEPLLAESLVRQLAQQPDLARMILATPELANSLTARPVTLHHLASRQQAIDVLGSVLDEIAERGAEAVAFEGVPDPLPTPLTDDQRRISANFPAEAERAVQAGFDVARKGDAEYRREYLDQLYVDAVRAQRDVGALAERLASGAPGFAETAVRPAPKDRKRVEDKIAKYQNNVAMLTDLAAAKVVFRDLADLYAALDILYRDEDVNILEFEDRFLGPQESGYRDVQMSLRMSNGHIAEFRLHLQALDEVASWEHALYKVRRDLKAVAKEQGRMMSPMEQALYDGVLKEEQRYFWRALQATSDGGPRK
ncbi:toxin glutamine deamidase domain-containing protein [Micromonospora peucetia]|uniref:toxin glutamine deamidase domain-containing protein n=1 Tax=Micromonospora peucetia TaxID=47871 RepID=UPI00225BBFA8|nr:toxin glutamine deamidase domain-containing protein [Micromonospora peucetia]MCX4386564.1 toxin glutamine deamidase domain-containing protein [Micromonospora peucetia]